MHDDDVRREFNRWADEGRGRGMRKGHWEITRRTIDIMDVGRSDNLCDLGCGVGWATRVLAEKAPRGVVAGLDLSDRMIEEALGAYRNPPNALFAVADAAGIPCRSDFFDALLSVESIYYYPDLEAALAEICRILRPGGRAYLLINYYRENPYSHRWADHLDIPVRLLGADEYGAMIEGVGFREVSSRRISDPTPIPRDFKPSVWFPSREDLEAFQVEGALLLMAQK